MTHIKLELPFPPSVNHYKTVGALVKTKSGKMYQKRVNSKDTTAYFYEVYMIGKRLHAWKGTKFFHDATIAIGMTAYLYPPKRIAQRRWDLDNRLKVLCDSLIHARIIADDSQITRLYVEKMGILDANGKVLVDLYELNKDGAIEGTHGNDCRSETQKEPCARRSND
jgi:Holliday junction resolvase RusA-like endonuclease